MSGDADRMLETRLAEALARVARLEQALAERSLADRDTSRHDTYEPGGGLIARLQVALADADRSRAQLEAVFDAVSDGIAVADMSGRFVLMNEAEAILNGHANTREMLRDLDSLTKVQELRTLDGRVLPPSEWPLARVLRGESLHDVVLQVRRHDLGRNGYFSFSAEPVRDETGKQVLAVVVTRDVTERRLAMVELRAANERLQQSEARKDEFLAVLSHELRNPLSAIRNSAYLLDRAAAGSEVGRRARAVIDRQVGHLARLVDDLLAATRITSDKVRLQRRALDLRDQIRDTVDDLRPAFETRGVQLSAELPTAPVLLEADPERLAQVVGNLLQHAASNARPGGHARVSLTLDPARHHAVITIADDGIDLAANTRERLSHGLALVRTLVEIHGGELSAPGDGLEPGARLRVRLPLAAIGPVTVGATPRLAAGLPRRVLIIEDNVDAAELLRDLLQLGDHTVALAFSGPDGLDCARSFRPDVVLCDIGLPTMDGYAVAAAIRADPELADTCLIALSGYAQPEDIRRATTAGFDHHVAKPPDLDRLEAILSSPDCGRP